MPVWQSADGHSFAIGDGPDLVLKHGAPVEIDGQRVAVQGFDIRRPDMEFTSYLHPSEGLCLASAIGLPLEVEGQTLYVSSTRPEAEQRPHLDKVRPILAKYMWNKDDREEDDDY